MRVLTAGETAFSAAAAGRPARKSARRIATAAANRVNWTWLFRIPRSLSDPRGFAPMRFPAALQHRRVVAATLEEEVRHLARARAGAVVLGRSTVHQVRGPDERLALPDRGIRGLDTGLVDAVADEPFVDRVVNVGVARPGAEVPHL